MKVFELSKDEIEQIDNKLFELEEICRIYNVPFFVCVATKNTEDDTEYKNIINSATANYIPLKRDLIRQHELIAAGFVAMPRRDKLEFNSLDLIKEPAPFKRKPGAEDNEGTAEEQEGKEAVEDSPPEGDDVH